MAAHPSLNWQKKRISTNESKNWVVYKIIDIPRPLRAKGGKGTSKGIPRRAHLCHNSGCQLKCVTKQQHQYQEGQHYCQCPKWAHRKNYLSQRSLWTLKIAWYRYTIRAIWYKRALLYVQCMKNGADVMKVEAIVIQTLLIALFPYVLSSQFGPKLLF